LRYLPHAVRPTKDSAHLVVCYKNFAAHKHISHIGLGVTALTNARILNAAGFYTEVWPILSAEELRNKLNYSRHLSAVGGGVPVSHAVISAPWLATSELRALTSLFHDINFVVTSHSNVGFLQADSNGLRLLREAGDLATATTNFRIGANTRRFVDWWEEVYRTPMRYLPNMYDLTTTKTVAQAWQRGAKLRIGSFGATRPLKNILTAGAAALEIAERLQADLEFWISANRMEGGGDTILRALQAMYADLPTAQLKLSGWQPWPGFRRIVRSMDLLLQPSYTESFCMVVADGIAEGVPSVTGEAIDWVPRRWVAATDDAGDIADVAIGLLFSPHAAGDGLAALQAHNKDGLEAWSNMLLGVA
jgi:hypothetical protein